MNSRTRLAAGVFAGCLVLAAPVAAQARTKKVDLGTPRSAQKTLQETYQSDANAFFPSTITINVGDKVSFTPQGFHNANLPKKGGQGLPALLPTGTKAANVLDAASQPFWFNGQDEIGFNPALLKSNFGKTLSYSGATAVNSGLPLAQRPKPFAVRFTKAGSYTYFCDIHGGMKGTVRVVRKGVAVPSAAADARRVKAQVTSAINVAKGLSKTDVPANTVNVGVPGKGGVELFDFHPKKLTVAPGTTVKFTMPKGSFEDHNAATGPGNPDKEPKSYLGQIAAGFEGPTPPAIAIYPSDPPGTLVGLTPTTHGNGFWNSGVLDARAGTPLPDSSSVRFDAPGTYEFYCLIHPFMHGTVTVQ